MNLTVGLSISESPDLERLGFGTVHLQDAMVEFARYLLAGGVTLAYGGDLRQGGFTQILFELLETHRYAGGDPLNRIVNALAWPSYLKLKKTDQARLKQIAKFQRIGPPADVVIDVEQFLPPDSTENRYIWARCLTHMREYMNQTIDVRLVLGGTLQGYNGKYPGLAEEAYLALQDQKPLFLIGAFGGCAKAIIDALEGGSPEGLSKKFQLQDVNYAELLRYYNDRIKQSPIDYSNLLMFFRKQGVRGLNNGLTEEENRRLFETPHIPEMIMLVLKGLRTISAE